jgi:hypothetical protein
MINGMPEPSLLAFLLNETPHLIELRFFHWLDLHTDLVRLHGLDGYIVDVFGPPGATGRKFTVRRSAVHSPHENRYLAVFQMAGKNE